MSEAMAAMVARLGRKATSLPPTDTMSTSSARRWSRRKMSCIEAGR